MARAKALVRLGFEGAFGSLIAASVFTGLTGLIAGAGGGANPTFIDARKIDFEFVPPREEPILPRPEKPKRDNPEPPPVLRVSGSGSGSCRDCAPVLVSPIARSAPVDHGGPHIDLNVRGSEGEPIPLVRIPPEYPPNGRGDGSVLVRFDISKIGTVENARVVESTPRGMFDKAALQAISRWRYRPAVMDGRAVERRGVQVRLRFELERA